MGTWSISRAARDGLATILGACLATSACGGDTDSGKTNAGGGAAKGGTADSGGGTGGTSAGGTNTGGTSAGGTNAGGTSAGGTPTGGSAGSIADGSAGSAGAGGTGTVSCGGPPNTWRDCGAGEYCCSPDCTAKDTPCSGPAFYCDDAADCPGELCCVDKISTVDHQVAQCKPTCDPETSLVMCRYSPAKDDCPPGMECQITATLPIGYGYCCAPGELCPTT